MKGYRFAVAWIAENDEPEDLDPEIVAGYISTSLVADLFEKDSIEVAQAIVTRRRNTCVICGRQIEPEPRFRTATGAPVHMLCYEKTTS